MLRPLLFASFTAIAALTLAACSDSNDETTPESSETSELNPDAEPAVDDGTGGGDTTSIAGLWDGSTTEDGVNDVVYWHLDDKGVLTRYDYQQDDVTTATRENCYIVGDPISVSPEDGDSYSIFNVATTVTVTDNTMTITFIDADINDLDNDGDTTEVPTMSWTLLNTPTLEDLNSCEVEMEEQVQTVGTDNNQDTDADGGDGNDSGIPFDNSGDRPFMTREECADAGGQVIGDIGNGAIHRPEYRCESGEPPIARIAFVEGEPIAAEGEVCCL